MDTVTARMMSVLEDLSDEEKMDRLLADFYSEQAVFEDPVQKAEGLKAIQKMMRSMARMFERIEADVLDDVRDDASLCIRWEMMFKFRYWPFEVNLPGVTWLELDQDGKCLRHTDYWDLFDFIRQTMPVAKPFERMLPAPIKRMLVGA